MTQPSRIVFLQNQLAELGGISTFCNVLSEGLADRGFRVEVGGIGPAREGATVAFAPSVNQFTLHDLNVEDFEGDVSDYWRDVDQQARERFANYDGNSIVIFTQLFARERSRAGWEDVDPRVGFRSIVQYHDTYSAAARGRDLRRAKSVYADADLFLLLTHDDARRFQQAGFNNTGYIWNPVSVDRFVRSAGDQQIVVSLGRYDRQKRLDQLVDAWSLLADKFPSWRLRLYGEGPLREQLEDQIELLGLSETISLEGRTDDVPLALSQASINALSSGHEGFPFALMEASAAGVPSVSYDCAPGVRDIIEHGRTGLITDRNKPKYLAESLGRLMEDSELRRSMATEGVQRMQAMFDTDTILDQWESTFQNVLR